MLDTGNLFITKIYYWMLLRGYVYLHSIQNRSYFVFYHRKICKAETNGFGLVGLYLAPDNTTVSHQLWELLVLVVSILSRLFFVVSLCSSFFWSSLSPQEPIFPGSLIFSSSRDISLWASALMKPTWSGCIAHVMLQKTESPPRQKKNKKKNNRHMTSWNNQSVACTSGCDIMFGVFSHWWGPQWQLH